MPDGFEQSVRPTVESRDFYGIDLLVPASSTDAVGALPALQVGLTLTDTLGLRALGCELQIGAAAATGVVLMWFFALPSFPAIAVPIGSQVIGGLPAGGIVFCGTAPLPFVLPPGTRLFAQAAGVAAGVDHRLGIRGLLENFRAI